MSEKQFPQTNGGRLVRRGDSRDPECWRTTHRLRAAASILKSQGIEPAFPQHAEDCESRRMQLGGLPRLRCSCGLGDGQQSAEWPEWVTGEMFDTAYRMADMIQTERGRWHQAQINAERRAA